MSDEIKEAKSEVIPAGYIKVELSTNGKLGAPSIFHLKSFGLEEVMRLFTSEPNERPIKICEAIQKLIWEKEVIVKDFHEKEVVETLIIMFRSFYGDTLKDIDYFPDQADWDRLAEKLGGKTSDEYIRKYQSYINKNWSPKINIELKNLDYYKTSSDIKKTAQITKKSGLNCKYAYPRYGDVAYMKDIISDRWEEEDKRWHSIADTIRFRRDSEDRLRNGENIDFKHMPYIPKAELDKYYEYEREKTDYIVSLVRAIRLVEYRGQDLTNENNWEAKIALAKDPEIDSATFDYLTRKWVELPICIKDKIKYYNPITEEEVEKDYPIKVEMILNSIKDIKPIGTEVTFI